MKLSWRDIVAAALAIFGGVIVFAKLESYSWWLIGSWKGALGVIIGVGVVVAGTYFIDWFENPTLAPLGEMSLWLLAATVAIGSLLATTTKAEFLSVATLIGVAWLAQLGAHTWDSTHDHPSHYAHVH
jgi:hypothetical protein